MNKTVFIEEISERLGVTKAKGADIYKTFEDVVIEGIENDGSVNLTGFIKFEKKDKPAKNARNPKTGETIKVPAKTVIKATISKVFNKG